MRVSNAPVSKAQLVGWFCLALVQAFGLGVMYANLDGRIAEGERFRTERSAKTDGNFATLNRRLESYETAMFRMAQNEAKVNELNARLDRIVESLVGKIDTMNESINGLRTDVRLLSQKVDAYPQRADNLNETPRALVR